jgi:hypothetical protein
MQSQLDDRGTVLARVYLVLVPIPPPEERFMKVDVRSDPAAFGALRREWEELEVRAQSTLPFRSWAWNASWWLTFPEDRLAVGDELRLFTVRDEAGTLRGVAPMMLTSRPSRGPLRLRVLQPFGTDPNITEIRGLLCAREDEAKVTRSLVSYTRMHEAEWDTVKWYGMRRDSAAVREIAAAGAIRWGHDVEESTVPLPGTWEELSARTLLLPPRRPGLAGHERPSRRRLRLGGRPPLPARRDGAALR